MKIPFTVIGSGIVGVLTALKLRELYPDQDIALLDKAPYPGHHSTTRNSGVLHAGIYYPTGSLKHKLCREGHAEWKRMSASLNIPLELCGKYIIATEQDELAVLESYQQRALANGVPGIRKMTVEERDELSPYTNALDGFFSPETGILDISAGIGILYSEAQKKGIHCLLNTEVKSVSSGLLVETDSDSFSTDHLINCAGLGAVDIRKHLGLMDIENEFVKGNYLKLNKPYYNKRLIYPVPLKNLTGLGVHTSFHMDKIVRFGPNTEKVQVLDYKNSDENLDLLWTDIRKKFKGIGREDLSLDYSGIRTKITRNGKLYPDFLIQSPIKGYYECLGIESPGLTAAPAIANFLARLIQDKLAL